MPPVQNSRGPKSDDPPGEARLEGWGEIALYLKREVRTVQRYEQMAKLPVHRFPTGTVYAYRSELDEWLRRDQNPPDPPAPDPIPKPPVAYPKWKIAVASAGLVLLGGLAVFLWLWFRTPPPAAPAPKVRLFVRAFKNLSGPADDEFTKGLTLEITSKLVRLDPDSLAVIAPTTAEKYSASTTSELMRILKVDYVLEGSVRRAKDKDEVRIDAQLITTADETLKWSDGYNGSLVDILNVEDRLVAGVAHALNIKPKRAAKIPPKTPVDINGYDAYLAGRRAWALRDLPGAVTAFQKAAKLLPTYAPAHSGLAAAYAVMGQSPNDGMEPRQSAPMAVKEAHIALQLDPRSAESHCVLGNLALSYDWDFPTAEREFREALALEPGNATAHQWLGQYFMVMNSIPEAQGETSQALELDPASPIFITARAEAFYYARDFDSTISHAQIAVQQFPQFVLGEFWLGSAYREKKMYAESLAHFQHALTLAPKNPALLMAYGHALAVSGDHAGAKAKLAELQAMSRDRYIPAIYFAGIYTGLGDTDNAFAWLQKAVQQRNDRLIYLREDPISDPLRADPRFAALMQQVHTAD